MSEILKNNIEEDLSKGIIAIWHDESHLNHYLFNNPPATELNSGYCFPEGAKLPFEKKILALTKNHSLYRV